MTLPRAFIPAPVPVIGLRLIDPQFERLSRFGGVGARSILSAFRSESYDVAA